MHTRTHTQLTRLPLHQLQSTQVLASRVAGTRPFSSPSLMDTLDSDFHSTPCSSSPCSSIAEFGVLLSPATSSGLPPRPRYPGGKSAKKPLHALTLVLTHSMHANSMLGTRATPGPNSFSGDSAQQHDFQCPLTPFQPECVLMGQHSERGIREYQEDVTCAVTLGTAEMPVAVFAVCDGHGGEHVSRRCGEGIQVLGVLFSSTGM